MMESSGVTVNISPPAPAQPNGATTAVGAQNGNGTLSPKQMTIPKNGVATNNSGISPAAAAADATAMPPPPPHTAAGLARTSAAVSAAPSTTLVTSVPKPATISITNIASVTRAPHSAVPTPLPRAPVTAARQAISASVLPSTIAVTKVSNPLAKTPTTVVTTTLGGGAVKPATTTATIATQRTLAASYNHALLANKPLTATKSIVPSPVLSTSTAKTIQQPGVVRTGVPRPVLHSIPATSRVETATVGRAQQQQRVVPKYLTKAPVGTIPGRTLKRTIVGTTHASGAKPVLMNGGRPAVSRPALTLSTVAKQHTTSPSAMQQQQQFRPTHVTSGIATAPVPMSAPQSMPPPPPPPPHESISTASTGGSSSSGNSKKKGGHPLRRGKWTSEEEAYAGRLINEFKSGLLPLTDGTTLRNFLSKLLNCDPMRISKKFVGNNCIGKQVFRRRVADINRLSPEQIQQMRIDLCELERRFFDRVSQTNRVKTPGVSSPMSMSIIGTPISNTINIINIGTAKVVREEIELDRPPTPPWLRPPANYKPKGKFAERLKKKQMAAEAAAARTAQAQAAVAAAVAVPQPPPVTTTVPIQKVSVSSTPPLVDVKSDTKKAMDAIQRSHSSLDRLAEAAQNNAIPRTESALEQLARTASAAKFVEDIVNGDSSLGDTQAEGGKKLSQATMQGSFEALMSMDIHSVENLVELASSHSSQLLSELTKTSSSDGGKHQSSGNMSSRMESFIKSLSSANLKAGFDSSVALGSLLNIASSNGNFDAENFAKRVESCTGFSALRAEDGLANGAHNSVEDFLSLVESGDLPHQDPNILKVPLQKVMQQTGIGQSGSKRKLSQQQLVALATRLGSSRSLSEMAAACAGSALKKRKKK